MPEFKSPTNLILLGVTGDLSSKKIIPAIYKLHRKNLLPEKFKITGVSHRELNIEGFYDFINNSLENHFSRKIQDQEFLSHFDYIKADFTDINAYKLISESLGMVDDRWNTCSNKLFYLAVSPKFYKPIIENLTHSNLHLPCSDDTGWTRIIIEKPFGKDSKTAMELEKLLSNSFKESQIYRIDHYLGKEMLENVLVFRFANNLLESNWSNRLVKEIRIGIYENFGVKNRINFYDGVGALRDVGQNHVLQMLALTTMERPSTYDASSLRKEKVRLLSSLQKFDDSLVRTNTLRGQYRGYIDNEGVEKNSQTETYFKIKTEIQSERWKGVSIILEGGKKLDQTNKLIQVKFIGNEFGENMVTFDLEGEDSGIYIDFFSKKSGITTEIEKRVLNFLFCEDNSCADFAEEYEHLLVDCINGNQMLFVSSEEIDAMWKFVDPIICGWEKNLVPLFIYDQFSSPFTDRKFSL